MYPKKLMIVEALRLIEWVFVGVHQTIQVAVECSVRTGEHILPAPASRTEVGQNRHTIRHPVRVPPLRRSFLKLGSINVASSCRSASTTFSLSGNNPEFLRRSIIFLSTDNKPKPSVMPSESCHRRKTTTDYNNRNKGGSLASDAVMRAVPVGSQPQLIPASTNRFPFPNSRPAAHPLTALDAAGFFSARRSTGAGATSARGGSLASDAVMRALPSDAVRTGHASHAAYAGGAPGLDREARERRSRAKAAKAKKADAEKRLKDAERAKKQAETVYVEAKRTASQAGKEAKAREISAERKQREADKSNMRAKKKKVGDAKKTGPKKKSVGPKSKRTRGGGDGDDLNSMFVSGMPDGSPSYAQPRSSTSNFGPSLGSAYPVLSATGATLGPRNFDTYSPVNPQGNRTHLPFALDSTPLTAATTKVDLSTNR